ncbi:MAG: NADH-quinone oxidoreductase subunit C [Anaerolineaceae bacterium]|nr:NADH-quinone oxidoreductase subunit C [Anaerolineaceae bacterium]
MEEKLQKAVDFIQEKYDASLEDFRGDITLHLSKENLYEAVKTLRETFDFEMLMEITAVDYWPGQTPRFHLIYNFYSLKNNFRLRLRVPLNGNEPEIKTIEGIYPNANWPEREVWDMFGIHFEGHSDPRRILMPAAWEGHPLRKDYPLGYEEVQFTFNYEEIDLNKPYPKE